MRILIAYDGSPDARVAVEEVATRPWPKGTQVRLITIVEQPIVIPPPNFEFYGPLIVGVQSSLREEAHKHIQEALGRFSERQDLEMTYEIRDGSPKVSLLEAIQEWKADLVVIGSHGKSRMERLLLGSVSHALVTSAPCSVEVARCRPEAA
jgi:nucleotide-binding universal stress UspA family protein